MDEPLHTALRLSHVQCILRRGRVGEALAIHVLVFEPLHVHTYDYVSRYKNQHGELYGMSLRKRPSSTVLTILTVIAVI